MDKAKEFYTKYRMIIWPVVVGISSVCILALVIIPQLLNYLSIRNKISEIEHRSSNLEVRASDLEQLDEESAKANLQVVFSVLPREQNVPEAMVALHDVISRSGLILKNTSYISARKSGNGENFQLSVGVGGQMSAIRDFLVHLQESQRLFQVESIVARFQRRMSLVEAELPISVYFDKSAASEVTSDQDVPKLTEKEEQLLAKLSRIVQQTSVVEDVSSVPYGKSDPFE